MATPPPPSSAFCRLVCITNLHAIHLTCFELSCVPAYHIAPNVFVCLFVCSFVSLTRCLFAFVGRAGAQWRHVRDNILVGQQHQLDWFLCHVPRHQRVHDDVTARPTNHRQMWASSLGFLEVFVRGSDGQTDNRLQCVMRPAEEGCIKLLQLLTKNVVLCQFTVQKMEIRHKTWHLAYVQCYRSEAQGQK